MDNKTSELLNITEMTRFDFTSIRPIVGRKPSIIGGEGREGGGGKSHL